MPGINSTIGNTSPTLRIVMTGPRLNLVGGVAQHVATLMLSPLGRMVAYDYFPVGSEGQSVGLARRAGRTMVSVLKFTQLVWQKRPDLAHINTSLNAKAFWRDMSLAFWAHLSGIPVLYQLHGGRLDVFLRDQPGAVERLAIGLFSLPTRVCVSSEQQRLPFVRAGLGEKVFVIPNMVDVLEFETLQPPGGQSSEEPTILFAARMVPEKGVLVVAKAAPLVLSRFPARFVFVGDGPTRLEALEICEKAGIRDRVVFTGYVAPGDIKRLMLEADLLVMPTTHEEGLPVTLLWALAAGLPIVASPVHGIAEVVEDGVNGVLVGSTREDSWADAMACLLENKDLRQWMAGNNKRKAQVQFDSSEVSELYFRLYRDVVTAYTGHVSCRRG